MAHGRFNHEAEPPPQKDYVGRPTQDKEAKPQITVEIKLSMDATNWSDFLASWQQACEYLIEHAGIDEAVAVIPAATRVELPRW